MESTFKEIDAFGNVYKGDVQNGKRHGKGMLLYADTGDVYQGDFEHGEPHGSGKYIKKEMMDGNRDGVYEGLWTHGKLTAVKKGKARLVSDNGDIYEGGFNHWKRHGRGKLIQYNGAIYKGMWKDGQRCGKGVQSYPDGYVFKGTFKDDTPVKDGTEREEFSVVFGSDQESIDLNPIRSRDLEQKVTKGFKRTNDRKSMRSISRGRSSRAQIYDSRDEGNNYSRSESRSRSQSRQREPSRANSRPRTSNNIPRPPSNRMQNENVRSESRKSRMPGNHDQQQPKTETPYDNLLFGENTGEIPRTVSFQSRNKNDIRFSDDSGVVGVENQITPAAPSQMKKKNSFGFFSRGSKSKVGSEAGSRQSKTTFVSKLDAGMDPAEAKLMHLRQLKSGQCLQKFAGNTMDRQISRQRSRQKKRDEDTDSKKSGFSFFRRDRSSSRSRRGSEQAPSEDVFIQESEKNTPSMFNFNNDPNPNPAIDLEEASGLTPPQFYQKKSSTSMNTRSNSPHPSTRNMQMPPRHDSRKGVSHQGRSSSRSNQSPMIPRSQSRNSRATSSRRNRSNSAPRQRDSSRSGSQRSTSRHDSLEKQYNDYNSYVESLHSKRSQHSDMYQVKSVSNKGSSATLTMLALNKSSSDDSDYFVK